MSFLEGLGIDSSSDEEVIVGDEASFEPKSSDDSRLIFSNTEHNGIESLTFYSFNSIWCQTLRYWKKNMSNSQHLCNLHTNIEIYYIKPYLSSSCVSVLPCSSNTKYIQQNLPVCCQTNLSSKNNFPHPQIMRRWEKKKFSFFPFKETTRTNCP